MHRFPLAFNLVIMLAILASFAGPVSAAKDTSFQTGFVRWRAAENGFAGWALSGVTLTTSGALELNLAGAADGADPYPSGGYYGGNFYNAGNFKVGEAIGPEMPADVAFTEAIVSWNADTPAGTWLETQFRVRLDHARWSKWYNMGIWASDTATVARHSVRLQGDADGYIAVDTFVLSAKKATVTDFQVKVRLFSAGTAVPSVRNVSVAYSTPAPKKGDQVSAPTGVNVTLNVPECSQMVYPNGGNVWCSPTSTSMILGYWGFMSGPCSERVQATVAGVYDWIYDGHGNWPFNTAFAAAQNYDVAHSYEGYVARFTSLAQLEPWIAAGVPVAISIAWKKGELTGAPVSSSNGHLMVVVGFDANGNPIVNDPAASTDPDVQRAYLRSEFESLWLSASGGTTYLIYPPGTDVPALP